MHDQPAEMSEEEFERRLLPIVTDLPTVVEGHALVKQYIAAEVARLKERQELVEYREARTRNAAIMTAKADITPDGEKRTRYYMMANRAEHAAHRELRALQDARRKYGEGDYDEFAGPEASAPAVVGRAHDEATASTEPVASETSDGVGFGGSDPVEGPAETVSGEVEEAQGKAVAGRAHDEATATQVAVGAEGRNEDPRISTIAFKRSAELSEAILEEEENYRKLIERLGSRESD